MGLVVKLATVAASSIAWAQTTPSPIAVSPAQPAAYQPFEITFPAWDGSPNWPVNVQLDGGILKLEYVAVENDLLPTAADVTVSVAGLAEGTYPVKLIQRIGSNVSEYDADRQITIAAPAATVPIFAFFNLRTHHYFMTASANEHNSITGGGAGSGWTVADQGFSVWPAAGPAPDAAQAVCRFYSQIVNSHFYTASSAECDGLRQAGTGWTYEGIAFRALVPERTSCPGGTIPVWRLFNNRAAQQDSNHRFVASSETYRSMIADGWVGEGVAFCSPN